MGSLYSYCLSTKRQVSLVISDVIYSEAMPTYKLWTLYSCRTA